MTSHATILETPIKPLSTGLRVGKLHINSQVLLAPMAGVTDVVFRGLVREFSPESLICTEMISSNGMVFSKRNDAKILDKGESDHPIAYQLAGHHEDVLLEAAEIIVSHRQPDLIDVNMGCPVKKITGNFEGCALMKSPDVAYKLLSALVKSVDVPVSVKFRLGWDNNSKNYLEFGQMAEAAGVSMVTLHARTRAQGYAPGCDWDAFGRLKQGLRIPVVANGDITSVDDARHVIDTYGVDGVMLGRAIQGHPWLIGDMDEALKTGQTIKNRSLEDIIPICMEHARRHCEYVGEHHGIKEMRKHLPWYVKGFRGASEFRARLTQVSTLLEVEACLNEILAAGR